MSSPAFPSSSSTPSATETVGTNNNGSPSSMFGAAGGAPLILVFLGAGLLVGAIFALLILRRFYPRRGLMPGYLGSGRDGDRRVPETPLLWHVPLDLPEEGDILKGITANKRFEKWDDITPLSAYFISDKDATSAESPLSPIRHTTSGRPNTQRPSGLRFLRSRRTQVTNPVAQTDVDPLPEPSINNQSGKLQVAVAIGMPHPPLEQSSVEQPYWTSVPDLCLGFVEVPWNIKAPNTAL